MTVIYTDNTTLQQQPGIRPVYITGYFECFDDLSGQGNYDLSHISIKAIDRAAAAMTDPTLPILLDIECFNLFTDYTNAVYQLRVALQRWKSADTRRMIGLYSSVPERNYWVPVLPHIVRSEAWDAAKMAAYRKQYKTWQSKNTKLSKDLVPYMDFLCPCLYAFVPTEDHHWTVYAEGHLLEALRIDKSKPVWPIIWPKYNNAGNIALPMWTKMVEFVSTFPGIKSMIAYAPNSATLINGWEHPVLKAMV